MIFDAWGFGVLGFWVEIIVTAKVVGLMWKSQFSLLVWSGPLIYAAKHCQLLGSSGICGSMV